VLARAAPPFKNGRAGTSVQANNQALLSLSGLAPEDVLLAEWSASDFRPCHYVAIDRRGGRIVVGVRGSLEVSDLYTDMAAAPVPWTFNGVRGFVHEGLLAAATYVHASVAGALAEAARRCPGAPVLLTGAGAGVGRRRLGDRLGGAMSGLVTGIARSSIDHVRL
jgi:hypothetical protein